MTNYVEAAVAPLRNTGDIRLYTKDDFAGMRRACQVTAGCLDELVDIVKPGVTTQAIDDFVYAYGIDHGAPKGVEFGGERSVCADLFGDRIGETLPVQLERASAAVEGEP